MAIGLCVLVTIGSVVRADLVDVVWVDIAHGGYRSLGGNWLVQAIGGPTPQRVHQLVVGALAGGALLTVGLGGRLVALLTLQCVIALTSLNPQAAGSYDLLLANALWILVLADSTATLSIDCRATTGAWTSDRPVTAWPRYLAAGQLVLMYWTTGLQKVSAFWTPLGGFSALYYILQQPTWSRTDLSWLAWVYPLTQVATAVTWMWELSTPLLLLALVWSGRDGPRRILGRRLRRIYVVLGVAFHVVVGTLMNVGPFSLISLAFYACLFRPDEHHAAWSRLRARLSR